MTQDPTGTGAGAAPGDAQPAGAQGADEAAARIAALEAQLAEAEAERAKLRDQALRAVAEAENTRRRVQREAEEREKFALSSFARELTSVVDNLRRALETLTPAARGADAGLDQFAQGVELTEREFMAILDRNGIKRVTPAGEAFPAQLAGVLAGLAGMLIGSLGPQAIRNSHAAHHKLPGLA